MTPYKKKRRQNWRRGEEWEAGREGTGWIGTVLHAGGECSVTSELIWVLWWPCSSEEESSEEEEDPAAVSCCLTNSLNCWHTYWALGGNTHARDEALQIGPCVYTFPLCFLLWQLPQQGIHFCLFWYSATLLCYARNRIRAPSDWEWASLPVSLRIKGR